MKCQKWFAFLVVCCLLTLLLGSMTATAAGDSIFKENFAHITKESLSVFPSTFEATMKFPSDMPYNDRGGVVFGNFVKGGQACINFEIHQHGNPRLYIADEAGKVYDYKFKDVNVYTGEWVHVALVRDAVAGTVSCYVNGELQETQTLKAPADITMNSRFALGGDLRTGNNQYFKGSLRNVTLYNDLRTADEIAADYQATTPDTDNLLGYYQPTDVSDVYKDPTGVGPDFVLTSRETFIKNYASVTDYDYSFAVIGDTQTITLWYPDDLTRLYDWIVDNAKDKKIAFVAGLGDITDADSDLEWERAEPEIAKLNGVVPYSIVRGNHDSVEQYEKYFSFDEYKDTVSGSFKDSMLNTYHTIKVKGNKYLFLNLDLHMEDDVLAWANEIIAQHKDHNVIITTHIYIGASGKTDGISTSSLDRYGAKNYPDALWDKVVSQHENISMVLCGHVPTDNIIVNQREGVHGNTVTEVLIDPQTTDETYTSTGMVAMLYFSDGGKTVDVEYYSTAKEGHFLADNQFRITVDVLPKTVSVWVWIAAGAVAALAAATVVIVCIRKKKTQKTR